MKLLSLDLKNFRQHVDSSIVFTDGVTGVIGPNGAGKTTILEAIAWALYGAPALRGTNDTVRSNASDGGAKPSVALTFELGGSVYRAARSLDSGGRSGHAFLEIDGKPLRSGMTEVTAAVAKLIGMDYQAFFTSFFTGQKQLEFMAALDGRARAVAISRMLGYDRLTKARDQANEDRKGLAREIDGLERGLTDPEDMKQRKKDAQSQFAMTAKTLEEAEAAQMKLREQVDRLKPLKEASDQKAKRRDEISRRLELDRSELSRSEARLAQLREEIADLEGKRKELDLLQPKLDEREQAKQEYQKLSELQKHESDRQRLAGRIASIEQEIKRLESRDRQLVNADVDQTRAAALLTEAEGILSDADTRTRTLREQRIADQRAAEVQIRQLASHKDEIEVKRARITEAGKDGKCPTCERPLADELPRVIANFDSQIGEIAEKIKALDAERQKLESDTSEIDKENSARGSLAGEVERLRNEKTKADALVMERDAVRRDLAARKTEFDGLATELAKLPTGFDQARFRELHKLGEDLAPVYKRAVEIQEALKRGPAVEREVADLAALAEMKSEAIMEAESALSELAFSPEEYEKLTVDFESASSKLNAADLVLERQRGEVNTARALLAAIEREEEAYKSRLEELQSRRSERLHLQTLAEALDRLRADLNDRIRPELESIASDLLSMMTDGRYNVLEVNDNYQAMIRDDGEMKPVISGGEDDIVNLALRLAISQMIADRAGQSFSLLVLDEVFGSLDDARRENVVSLLQNLKNRFEQIILITHVESIHDAVDNCLWVEFDERTKTSRLSDRSSKFEQPEAGTLV